jgi:hypothetical protein
MRSFPRPARLALWRVAIWLGIWVVLAGGAALAADTGNGSKNFRTPNSVPNYFANEAGPMVGGAAESRRGELFPSQTASLPRSEESVAPPAYRAETRRVTVAHGRTHLAARTPDARRHVAMRSRFPGHVAASHRAAAGQSRHAASRPTHVGGAHRHARG